MVKDYSGRSTFTGQCWPGLSAYVDFMNQDGRDFWGSLYSFGFFNGTDDLFHAWLDMNEPSVFDGPEGTMPKTVIHTVDGG